MTKERWEQFALFQEQMALSLTKNEQFARKTDERILNPGFVTVLINFGTVQDYKTESQDSKLLIINIYIYNCAVII